MLVVNCINTIDFLVFEMTNTSWVGVAIKLIPSLVKIPLSTSVTATDWYYYYNTMFVFLFSLHKIGITIKLKIELKT